MEFHKYANLFPMLPEAELQSLSDDISEHGLNEPVVLLDDKVLDGRNRWTACEMAGVTAETVDYKGDDPLAFVFSSNLRRRHLTETQRGMIAVDLANMTKHDNQHTKVVASKEATTISQPEAAAMLDVGRSTVQRCKKVLEEGTPDMIAAARSGEVAVTKLVYAIKEDKRAEARQKNQVVVDNSDSMKNLSGVFSTILIDPPWDWSDEGDVNQMGRAKPDYATMTESELSNIPIPEWADDDCHMYCWVTNRSMPKVFRLMGAWGFRYIALLTWPKTSFGLGNYFRGQTEHIAFGVKGSLPLARKDASTLLPSWSRGSNHSSKPEEVYDFIESCSPGPYLEIFGRGKNIDRWTVVGEGDV